MNHPACEKSMIKAALGTNTATTQKKIRRKSPDHVEENHQIARNRSSTAPLFTHCQRKRVTEQQKILGVSHNSPK